MTRQTTTFFNHVFNYIVETFIFKSINFGKIAFIVFTRGIITQAILDQTVFYHNQ
ncbi:hypothetical protein SDC9_195932 [bioreactor metagenome]|uniref:Uncharacterized protein n=1 Tax=bioreactor metagenome TaxID=1076179 RepID=A0A645IAP0_9ZZZZ